MAAEWMASATRVMAGTHRAVRQDAEAARALQEAQAAQREAARQAAQAARDAAQAGREAALQGARAAQEARLQAREAMRQAQEEMARAAREGQPVVGFQPFPTGPQIPEGAVIISVAFFVMCAVIAIGVPIVRAIARRMDKRGVAAPVGDSETRARLERIEQAVDAIAVEVERISEGQRFTTKIVSELRALPQPDPAAGLGDRGSPDRSAAPISRAREAR